MFMDDHVTANLSGIEAIVPDLQQADGLIGDDMEDEDIESMVACIDQQSFETVVVFIQPATEVVGHQEAQYGGKWEREELLERRAPVHVGCKVFREEEYHRSKEQGEPESGIVAHDLMAVGLDILSEDKANAEEEAAHHLAVAPLYDIHHLQSFPGLPGAEQEHEEADEIGDGCFRCASLSSPTSQARKTGI